MSAWQTLGDVAPGALVEARLQAHHATQIVSSLGVTFLEPTPDDSHPNLGWDATHRALVGRTLPESELRAALCVETLSLLVLDGNARIEEIALRGQRVATAYGGLQKVLEAHAAPPPGGALVPPKYDIPLHAVGDGAPFAFEDPAAFGELARWFANGHLALARLAQRRAEATVVRCWPHHFDLGGLFVVATAHHGQLASSVGFGLSPGDASFPAPYFYVSPWPAPARDALPQREGLHWHTQGFTSAVLTAEALIAGGPPKEQEQRVQRFLDTAFAASHEVLC